jgi:excisionase family DNA binding protein
VERERWRRAAGTPHAEAIEDLAALIGMTADYVYALSRRGAIPVVRFGRSVRFRRDSIQGWLASLEASGR